jgi:hypothetical protein
MKKTVRQSVLFYKFGLGLFVLIILCAFGVQHFKGTLQKVAYLSSLVLSGMFMVCFLLSLCLSNSEDRGK